MSKDQGKFAVSRWKANTNAITWHDAEHHPRNVFSYVGVASFTVIKFNGEYEIVPMRGYCPDMSRFMLIHGGAVGHSIRVKRAGKSAGRRHQRIA